MSDMISPKDRRAFVAVVGRPNVGKSTLFNRLIGERRSITDPTPGVTRDPVEYNYNLEDLSVRLLDTGGFKLGKEGFDPLVTDRSLKAIDECDLILLLVDATETTGEDEEFISLLRKYKDKTIFVINKVDSQKREMEAYSYYSYGYSDVQMISAAHGINIGELEELLYDRLKSMGFESFDYDELEENISDDREIRLTLIGQPNTGKSTLNNLLTKRESSIVSEIPGTTRDIINGSFVFEDREFVITDTAGIRRKKKVNEDVEYYSVNRAISTIDNSDIVFLMVDADKGLAEQDKKIANLAVRKGKGIVIVLNKWDLIADVKNSENAIKDRIRFLFPILGFAPIVPISALNDTGIKNLLKTSIRIFNQLNKRIETNVMNRVISDWIYDQPIPMKKNKSFKVKYLTQVSANPVRFLMFVNRSKGFPESWIQYVVNRIRRDLGFKDIPIRIDIKE